MLEVQYHVMTSTIAFQLIYLFFVIIINNEIVIKRPEEPESFSEELSTNTIISDLY